VMIAPQARGLVCTGKRVGIFPLPIMIPLSQIGECWWMGVVQHNCRNVCEVYQVSRYAITSPTLLLSAPRQRAESGGSFSDRLWECYRLLKTTALHGELTFGNLFKGSSVARCWTRKVDVRLPGKGTSNSHGARPVRLIITMIK